MHGYGALAPLDFAPPRGGVHPWLWRSLLVPRSTPPPYFVGGALSLPFTRSPPAPLGGGIPLSPLLLFSRSDRAWPFSDEGHKSSALRIICWPRYFWRWWEVDAVSAIRFQQTRSSTLGSAAFRIPPSLDALSAVGDGAPGARIPAPSVRLALGRHDVKRWRVGGLCWRKVPPRVAKSVCWRWMVRGEAASCAVVSSRLRWPVVVVGALAWKILWGAGRL